MHSDTNCIFVLGNTEEQSPKPTENAEPEHLMIIKTIPPSISRSQIVERCSTVPGYKRLYFTDPNVNKKFHRIGFIEFEEPGQVEQAKEALSNVSVCCCVSLLDW